MRLYVCVGNGSCENTNLRPLLPCIISSGSLPFSALASSPTFSLLLSPRFSPASLPCFSPASLPCFSSCSPSSSLANPWHTNVCPSPFYVPS